MFPKTDDLIPRFWRIPQSRPPLEITDGGESMIKVDYEEKTLTVSKTGLIKVFASFQFDENRIGDIDTIITALTSVKTDLIKQKEDYKKKCKVV